MNINEGKTISVTFEGMHYNFDGTEYARAYIRLEVERDGQHFNSCIINAVDTSHYSDRNLGVEYAKDRKPAVAKKQQEQIMAVYTSLVGNFQYDISVEEVTELYLRVFEELEQVNADHAKSVAEFNRQFSKES